MHVINLYKLWMSLLTIIVCIIPALINAMLESLSLIVQPYLFLKILQWNVNTPDSFLIVPINMSFIIQRGIKLIFWLNEFYTLTGDTYFYIYIILNEINEKHPSDKNFIFINPRWVFTSSIILIRNLELLYMQLLLSWLKSKHTWAKPNNIWSKSVKLQFARA